MMLLFWSCQNQPHKSDAVVPANFSKPSDEKVRGAKLSDYWYKGNAEISRYELTQNRYGDLHPGYAVMIFVTEDFLTDKQVKNDRYQNPNSINVLKNNQIKKFPTGIYDYSVMSSVFTPVDPLDFPNTLKVSTSSQEWCGHTYSQINLKKDQYLTELHSYFESEADMLTSLDVAILEDELFNRIRLNPMTLPTGKIKIIPSTQIARLMHLDYSVVDAEASLADYSGDDFESTSFMVYKVRFLSLERTLEIVFEKKSPYKIEGWTDSYPSMFDQKIRKTIAKKTHERYSPYWKENSLSEMNLRETLGLPDF